MPKKLALLALTTFVVGIGLGSLVFVSALFLCFILLLSAGLFFAWFFARRLSYLILALILAGTVLGVGRVALAPRALPEAFRPLIDMRVERTGTIVADPDVRESTQRIPVELTEGDSHTRILVVAERFPEFEYGDIVTVMGTLTRPEPFETDGGRAFAYDAFLAKDGIFAILPHAHIEKIGESKSVLVSGRRSLYEAKHAFARALEDALPEPHAALAEGILTGGKQGLGEGLLDAFTVAGLLPIVVLSGYNVMIIAQAVFIGLAFLPRRASTIIAAIVIGLFVLAAGTGASAVRAGLMAGLTLFARTTGRTYHALRALIVVFIFLLLVNPLLLLYDPGFQFSFVATLGLVVASPAFEKHLVRIPTKFMREIIATTLAAQVFVLPLLLYQTGNLSLVAVPANVLVLPVVPLAMALSALAGFLALLLPPLAVFVGVPAFGALAYIVGVAEVAAALPLAQIIVPAFPAALLIPLYGLVVYVVVVLTRSHPKIVPQP